jgi:hypothetical protein
LEGDVSTESQQEAQEAPRRRFPAAFWSVIAIVVWALVLTTLLDRTPYSLNEVTARVVLLIWSISDQVASPVATLGVPDARAAYLVPAAIPFSGSLVAVKLCTLLYLVAFALGAHRWMSARIGAEAPPLSTGMLLLAPLSVASIDAVAVAPFLAFTLWAAAKADEDLRIHRVRFGGLYFVELILVIAAVTLHPAGLACPFVLAAAWLFDAPAEPKDRAMIPGRERTHVLAGLAVATLLGLLLASGWHGQAWLRNPLLALGIDNFPNLADAFGSHSLAWIIGATLAACVLACAWKIRLGIAGDRLATMLLAAIGIGAFAGDACFAFLVLVLLLYWGFPLLLGARIGAVGGFIGARGLGFAALLVLSTAFLAADRDRFELVRDGVPRSVQDQLIDQLAQNVQRTDAPSAAQRAQGAADAAAHGPRVASQWPGRTMLACRCAALPLPPALEDQARFEANLHGLDYVLFDPQDPANRELSGNFALLGGARVETLALQPGGALLHLRPVPQERVEPAHPPG